MCGRLHQGRPTPFIEWRQVSSPFQEGQDPGRRLFSLLGFVLFTLPSAEAFGVAQDCCGTLQRVDPRVRLTRITSSSKILRTCAQRSSVDFDMVKRLRQRCEGADNNRCERSIG